MSGAQSYAAELSQLRVIKEDDKKIIAAAKWMPRVELTCCNKRCLLLGGHTAATNSIMVWCTCGEPDGTHPESSRLLALDFWVIEHCRGESLSSYENEEDEEDEDGGKDPVDRLCMEEALVVRAGPNVLPKQIPLRQLLSSTLVAQGGNKELKGVSFWVYWYDQPIPTPNAPEHAGMGRVWAPGQLAVKNLGVWYRARIVKCDTSTGLVEIKYDVDGSVDEMYLLVAFAHFGAEAPVPGARPDVLPHLDKIQHLGLPQSATKGPGAKQAKVAAVKPAKRSSATAHPAALAPVAKPPPAAAPAAAPSAKARPQPPAASTAAAAPTTQQATKPAAATRASQAVSEDDLLDLAAEPGPKAKKVKLTRPATAAAAAAPPQPAVRAPSPAAATAAAATTAAPAKASAASAKRPSPPVAPAQPAGAAQAGAGASAASAARGSSQPAAQRLGSGGAAGRSGSVPPAAKRPRHEFEPLPLAAGLNAVPAAAAAMGPLDPACWAKLEAAAKARKGYRGLLCGRQEQVPIFVFNNVDSAPAPQFEYVTGPQFESRVEQFCAEAGRAQPAVAAAMEDLRGLCATAQPSWGGACGLDYHRAVRRREQQDQQRLPAPSAGCSDPEGPGDSCYGDHGRLLSTRPLGVHECSPSCSSSACKANIVVLAGPQRPLEVFRTSDRRWGLRCPQPLEPGDFVAPLLGRLVAAAQLAEAGTPGGQPAGGHAGGAAGLGPPGVVLLNHFFGLWEAVFVRGLNWCERHLRLWQLPPNPLSHALCTPMPAGAAQTPAAALRGDGSRGGSETADSDPVRPAPRRLAPMLALDTRAVGNVARFVRHWTPGGGGDSVGVGSDPGPALIAQPVLAGSCRSPLLYYVGLFAARRIEAMEELTCDFAGMALEGGVGPGGLAGPAQ